VGRISVYGIYYSDHCPKLSDWKSVRPEFLRTAKRSWDFFIKSSQNNIQEYNEIPRNPWQTSGQDPWTRILQQVYESTDFRVLGTAITKRFESGKEDLEINRTVEGWRESYLRTPKAMTSTIKIATVAQFLKDDPAIAAPASYWYLRGFPIADKAVVPCVDLKALTEVQNHS
jgi:hypothetical protein